MSCSQCTAVATHTRLVAENQRQLFCENCYHRDSEVALVGLPSWEEFNGKYGVPQTPRRGPAVGITVFGQLGDAIAQRIIQVSMRTTLPFEEISLRDLMIKQHSAYYHASTYWAEWFSSQHREAKQLARLLEDTVDLLISINPKVLRLLLADKPSDVMREMLPPEEDTLTSGQIRNRATKARRIRRDTIVNPSNWIQRLNGHTALFPRQYTVIENAWSEGPLDVLQVGLIYLTRWREQPSQFARLFQREMIDAFTTFGERMFTESQRALPVQAQSYWK